jgi:hypothetical protein
MDLLVSREDAETDWQILMGLERDDLLRTLSVIEDAEIIEFEIVHRDAVEVGGVEGKADLIDRDIQSVCVDGSRRELRRLRRDSGESAHRCEHHAEMDHLVVDWVHVGL